MTEARGRLRSVSVGYNPVEDRLRLFVRFDDGVEASLWLTRRFSHLLLKKLEAMAGELTGAADAVAREAIKEFQREAALSGADIKAGPPPGEPSAQAFANPFLCTRFDARRLEEDRFHVRFAGEDGGWLGLKLDGRLLHTLVRLLHEAVAKADWRLPDVPAPSPGPQPASVN